ncbi:flocculation protein FLO11-like [Lactuca sativa]|uniref:flocculation protein FLO11-like n=1 Tax=Lactuca sativa TaxID=4236 RepID=UPI000CD80408|nr:flocculation protein FLO11-like [Lactuca sativa]
MADYRKLTPKEPRVLSLEQQAAMEAVDKPGNRGKWATTKKETIEEDKSKSSKLKKRKSEKGDSSKLKKIKKMAKKSKSPTPPSSENHEEDEEEEIRHDSPRGNTPPLSPTPTESPHNKLPTPPPSPKQIVPVSVVTIPPPTTSQTITSFPPPPPVSSIPISTTSLPPPIISQSTTTTIPEPTVGVNVSDTGVTTKTEPPVITKPLSPSHSTDSGATLGGANDEYDSTYFSPYRLPTDEDDDAPITSQHLQSIHEKLDKLLDDSKSYSGVVIKAFLDTAQQYTGSIDKSTKAVNESTSSCQKASADVADIVHTPQIFLESLKGHADTSTARVQDSVDFFSKSLQEEHTKFEDVRSSIQAENTSLLSSVSSGIESLHADLAKEKRVVFRSCAGDVTDMLTNILGAHDPILTMTIQNHLTTKLLPALSLLHEMKSVSERFISPKQGERDKVTTELKDNIASGSGSQAKRKEIEDDSDDDVEETIAEALKRKKRDRELDETLKITREAEERERRNKEEEEALN